MASGSEPKASGGHQDGAIPLYCNRFRKRLTRFTRIFSDGSALELATITGDVGSGLRAALSVAVTG
jgi:hypothetical protein